MNRFRKTATLLTALLILVSTTNIVFSAHFCSGKISGVSLFESKAEFPCCSSGEHHKENHTHGETTVKTILCCTGLVFSEKGIDLVYISSQERDSRFKLPVNIIIPDVNQLLSESFKFNPKSFKPFLNLPAYRDITILVQSFLL